MRAQVVLVVLAFAAARAHAEPVAPLAAVAPIAPDAIDGDANEIPTGGAHYASLGIESISLSTPAMPADLATAATVDAGIRLGSSPFYAHVAGGIAHSRYADGRAGMEVRLGGVVKGVLGIDLGYQHDARDVDEMYDVTGAYVAPRLGLEVGTPGLWLRGLVDWRYTLATRPTGHATSLGLLVGRDF